MILARDGAERARSLIQRRMVSIRRSGVTTTFLIGVVIQVHAQHEIAQDP
jgi:hypothetical protein